MRIGQVRNRKSSMKNRRNKFSGLKWAVVLVLVGVRCSMAQQLRVVTLNSAITETVFALGMGDNIVATDVTSISPKAAADLPRVSRNRSISAEGVMAFHPHIVLAPEKDVPPAVAQHLRQSVFRLKAIGQRFFENEAIRLIKEVANALIIPKRGNKAVLRPN